MPKLKNILIFGGVAVVIIFAYIFFFKKAPEDTASLVSTSPTPIATTTTTTDAPGSAVAQNFLSVLLNVSNIKLNYAIFSDIAFQGLHDSSITLIQDGKEGRPNPFAPIGIDPISTTASSGAIITTPPPYQSNSGTTTIKP